MFLSRNCIKTNEKYVDGVYNITIEDETRGITVTYTDKGDICIINNGIEHNINFNDLKDIAIAQEKICIMREHLLLICDFDGAVKRTIHAPPNYTFNKFIKIGDSLEVSCTVTEVNTDKHDRTEWNFKYNKQLGYWEHIGLSD